MNLFMIYLKKKKYIYIYIYNMAPMVAAQLAASNPDLVKTALKGWVAWLFFIWCTCFCLILSCCAYLFKGDDDDKSS